MKFEIQMPRRHRSLGISNNSTNNTPRRLFCNNNENKYFISILPRQENRDDRSPLRLICDVILIQNCRESCSLLHPRDLRNADM